MDFIVNEPDPLLDAFFDKFNSAWLRPNQVEGFRAYALSLLSEAHRKNIEALSAKIVKQPYHRPDAAGDERAGAGLVEAIPLGRTRCVGTPAASAISMPRIFSREAITRKPCREAIRCGCAPGHFRASARCRLGGCPAELPWP